MKRYQRGDAGATMVVVMLLMALGFFWWGGMHGGGGGHMGEDRRAARMENKALERLDEAYARGEVSREEYLQRRADLQQSRP